MVRFPLLGSIRQGVRPSHGAIVVPEFATCKREQVKVPVYDSKGKQVSTRTEVRVSRSLISYDEFSHKGLTASMFSVEAMQDAGIPMQQITKPFIGIDLDKRSDIQDYIEGFDYESLIDSSSSDDSNV